MRKDDMKKAVVIGASSGIGRELSVQLLQKGYAVGVMARRVPLLESFRDGAQGEVFVEGIDVSEPESATRALSGLLDRMGGADLIVICAGTGHLNPELDWTLEEDTIATNVSGFSAMVNVAFQHFVQRGGGHLVGITSIAALRGSREAPAYNASKAFQSNYLEGLRQKARKMGLPIAVTDIKPGFVKTAMAQGEGIFWAAEVEKAALQIYGAIERRSRGTYVTRRWRLIAWVLKAMPRSVYERL